MTTGTVTPTPAGGEGVDPDRLAEYAELHASVADAAALLGVCEAALQRLLDDPEGACARIWRQGRARARIGVRRAQFAQMDKNATLAIHLGKELLGQDETAAGGPHTYVVNTGIHRSEDA